VASNATSNRLIAELITARDKAEQHLDDPDGSRLSGTGMIRHLADVLTRFIDEVSAELENMAPVELQPTDEWGRPRCQETDTYVDAPREYQCAMVVGHAGECDPLPIEPESAEQHEHHFPAGPVNETGGADPADCSCGMTYDQHISELTDPRL
jgi:hypothetical protein